MHWRNKSVLSVTIISWMGTVERLVFLDFNIHLESPNTGNITPLQCSAMNVVMFQMIMKIWKTERQEQ